MNALNDISPKSAIFLLNYNEMTISKNMQSSPHDFIKGNLLNFGITYCKME